MVIIYSHELTKKQRNHIFSGRSEKKKQLISEHIENVEKIDDKITSILNRFRDPNKINDTHFNSFKTKKEIKEWEKRNDLRTPLNRSKTFIILKKKKHFRCIKLTDKNKNPL